MKATTVPTIESQGLVDPDRLRGALLTMREAGPEGITREALRLGMGDVKLAGVAGLYLGISAVGPFLVTTGALGLGFGLVWRLSGRGARFPLGPALAVALLVWL